MKKPSTLFSIHSRADGQFSTLAICVHVPKPWDSDSHRELVEFHWQASAEDRSQWYGFHCEVRHTEDHVAMMARAAKLLAKVMPANGDTDPEAFIASLEAAGIHRAAYDCRVSRYVLETEAIDPALICYLDDWSGYRGGRADGCTVKALAKDDEDAKRVLEKEFLAYMAKGYHGTAETFAAWVTAGRPVRQAYEGRKAAEYPPVRSLLNRPETETVAAAA